MPNTSRLRQRVVALLQDDGAELTTISTAEPGTLSEVDSCIAEALIEYAGDRPRNASSLVNGTGEDIDITSGTNAGVYREMIAWDNAASFLRYIEPTIVSEGSEPSKLYPGADFILYPEGDTTPTAIRFLTTEPASGTNNVRLAYKSLHRFYHPPGGLHITINGTAGTTSYTYAVTTVDDTGESLACPPVTTGTGAATLNGTDYPTLTWDPVHGATSYKVYRVASGGTPSTTGLIGTVTHPTATLDDTGLAGGSEALPVADTTLTSVEHRYLEAVARLSAAYCLEEIATKKAGNVDVNFNGDTTDFPGMMERYAARASAYREFYNLRVKPDTANNRAGVISSVRNLRNSQGGRYLFEEYNRRESRR